MVLERKRMAETKLEKTASLEADREVKPTDVVVDEAALRRALFKLDTIFLPVITLIYVRPKRGAAKPDDGSE